MADIVEAVFHHRESAQDVINRATGGERSGPGGEARAWELAGQWYAKAQIQLAANELLLAKVASLTRELEMARADQALGVEIVHDATAKAESAERLLEKVAKLEKLLRDLASAAESWVEQWHDLNGALIEQGLLDDPKYSAPAVPNHLFVGNVDAFEDVRAVLAEVPPDLRVQTGAPANG